MKDDCAALKRHISRIVKEALAKGNSVDIDGFGTFVPVRGRKFRFIAQNQPRVFIAYVEEDLEYATRIYRAFEQNGFRPWLDKQKLMPGQNWPRSIETAIQTSDFFVACFSARSTVKRGTFHSELRYALTCAARVPLDEIFLIPLRLDDCLVPHRIARQIQYVDLFPRWDVGVERVLRIMRRQQQNRQRKNLPLAG